MTRLSFRTYALFFAIICWATLLGGITYSHIVYFPPYLSDLPNSSVIVNGKYGLQEAWFWLTVHPLLILSLIITLALNWKIKPRRKLIMTSFGIYFVILVITQSYFLPELGAFRQSPELNVPAAEWLARGNRWQHLSWIRGAICYLAFVPLLIALTKPEEIAKAPEAETLAV
ncbi:MAG: hypothetical protein WA584_17265 [Pyrinomonadaceae bacterium]